MGAQVSDEIGKEIEQQHPDWISKGQTSTEPKVKP